MEKHEGEFENYKHSVVNFRSHIKPTREIFRHVLGRSFEFSIFFSCVLHLRIFE